MARSTKNSKVNGSANKNAMYFALVNAHNSGNTKAITDELATASKVTADEFKAWKSDVKALQAVVWEYVKLKNTARCESVENEKLIAARELIFPKWKEVLSGGEKRALERQLHVDPTDVEDLIGFCWKFMVAGEAGTIQSKTGETVFRKYVESLLGVIIAKNEILDDDDRDVLTAYYSYQKTIENCVSKKADLNTTLKSYKLKLGEVKGKEEKFEAFLNAMINEVKTEIAELDKSKAKAEVDRDKIADKAQAIEARLKRI